MPAMAASTQVDAREFQNLSIFLYYRLIHLVTNSLNLIGAFTACKKNSAGNWFFIGCRRNKFLKLHLQFKKRLASSVFSNIICEF